MQKIKNLVNILVMIYLVVALLIYLNILNVGQQTNPNFYTNFYLAGGVLMLLELITENIYILLLKRGQVQYQRKINELKASLYDQEREIQNLTQKRNEEVAATQTTTGHVAPQARPTTYQPVLTPIDPDIIINPAPLPPKPVNPADNPTKNTDSDRYREPNR